MARKIINSITNKGFIKRFSIFTLPCKEISTICEIKIHSYNLVSHMMDIKG